MHGWVVVLRWACLGACLLWGLVGGVIGAPSGLVWADSGLRAVDETPLNGRAPLILVHGINPAPEKTYNWQGFLNFVADDQAFQRRYKPYLFVFDPREPLSRNARALRQALRQWSDEHDGHAPWSLVGLSLGGLVIQAALEARDLRGESAQVIALGTPFHGTPLAHPDWLEHGLKQRPVWHPLRRMAPVAYRATRVKFPHFAQDYCWDDFDGGVVRPDSLALGGCPRRTAVDASRWQGPAVLFRTYAGFFGEGDAVLSRLRSAQPVTGRAEPVLEHPGERRALKRRRAWPVGRHVMFDWLQPVLSDATQRDRVQPGHQEEADGLAWLGLNDGISPIASQLWLGRFVSDVREGGSATRSAEQLLNRRARQLSNALVALKNRQQARLFSGLNHRDWLEGTTREAHAQGRVRDWLNPQEPPRSVFEWLRHDLMSPSPQPMAVFGMPRLGQAALPPVAPLHALSHP